MKSQNRIRLGLIVLAGGLLMFGYGCRNTALMRNGQVKADELRPLRISAFRSVYGTKYLLAEAVREYENGWRASSSSGYDSYSTNNNYAAFNCIFLNPHDLTSQWLLPNSNYFFSQIRELPLVDSTRETEKEKRQLPPRPATQMMLYVVVKANTNDNNVLDEGDRKTIAVSAVSGNGYTEIIQDVDEIIHQQMHSPDEFLLVYRSGAKHVAVKLNLKTQQLTQTNELAPIPKAQTPLS